MDSVIRPADTRRKRDIDGVGGGGGFEHTNPTQPDPFHVGVPACVFPGAHAGFAGGVGAFGLLHDGCDQAPLFPFPQDQVP